MKDNAAIFDKKVIYNIIMSLDKLDSFVVNDEYSCTFDFSDSQHLKPLFIDFKKEASSPRRSFEINVLVYDIVKRMNFDGKIVLSIDDDLINKYNASIYVKKIGSDNWESGTTILKLDNLKKTL